MSSKKVNKGRTQMWNIEEEIVNVYTERNKNMTISKYKLKNTCDRGKKGWKHLK